jgi:hypothetical protein
MAILGICAGSSSGWLGYLPWLLVLGIGVTGGIAIEQRLGLHRDHEAGSTDEARELEYSGSTSGD